MAEDTQFVKRVTELSSRAARTGIPTQTEFLTLDEQSTLSALRLPAPAQLFGGYANAERRIAIFGGEASEAETVAVVRIAPASKRFSETLTHRDFLGALMASGVRREVLGDIVLEDNEGYLFCLPSIAQYLCDALTEVRRTPVRCTLSEPPQKAAELPPPTGVVIAS